MKKKLSLYSSIISIMLCMAMIVGATYALFSSTDTINIAVNAANVSVDAYIDEASLITYSMGVATDTVGKFELGGTVGYDQETGDWTLDQIAPGDKAVFNILMTNSSTIDVMYRLTWAVEGELKGALVAATGGDKLENGTSEWYEWEWSAESNNMKKTVPVSIELPYETGNEYQGKTAKISFTVEAVQGNAVIDNVASEEQLQTLMMMGGGEAVLTDDVTLTEELVIDAGKTLDLTLAGNKLEIAEGASIVNNGTLKIDGSVVRTYAMRATTSANAVISATGASAIVNKGTLTIANVDVVGEIAKADEVGVIVNLGTMELVNGSVVSTLANGASAIYNAGKLTITGTEIVGAPLADVEYPEYAIYNAGNLVVNEGTTVTSDRGALRVDNGVATINGGSFVVTNAAGDRGMTLHTIYAKGSKGVLTINDGNFVNNYVLGSGSSVVCPAGAAITINGGNFSDPVTSTSNFNNTANIQNYMGYGVPVYVYGGTFNDASVIKNVAPKYYEAVLNDETGIYTVQPKEGVFVVDNGTDFAKAIETNTNATVVLNSNIDLSKTVAVATGKTIAIDLNGYTISGIFNGTGNQEMFLVKGNLTVTNGNITMNDVQNQGWNSMSAIFDITAGGVLNLDGVNAENLGGTDMNFVAHLNNWGTATLNVNNSTLKATYVAVRVFNSGNDMNTVVIKNSSVLSDGNAAFWVHNYTAADFGSQAKADIQKGLLNVTFENVEFKAAKAAFRCGMTNAEWYTEDGTALVSTADALIAALEAGKNVIMLNDIKIDPAKMSNAYGTTGIRVKEGQVLDGNGYTLDVKGAGGTWDSGICTNGGCVVKNITITGSFRGIFIKSGNTPVILENVTTTGTTYTISSDKATEQGLKATNCNFYGWTSFAGTLGYAEFTNCTFGAGSGNNFSRPYAPTTYVGCTFEEGHRLDPRAAVSFENCTIAGEALTAENLSTLVTNTANASVK